MTPGKPHIVVLTAGPDHLLREICAGIEEEGVPYEVSPLTTEVTEGASGAARRSALEVGIALDAAGVHVVHHAKLPAGQPVSRTGTATPRTARRAGHDAARIAVRAPLTLEESA
ncbi:glycerol dehydratase reactivase beta/small subunit family protein [Kineosporia succinea]|uniref:Dehydratase medium subunit n=1 Tax=Kineosporia succinea TaxID=84632 RepID=A0ABT9NZR5_9ACTN|nr:glycerol dehydratase reactivase beta/small subunit family protein [Kineosporia succinea]MDP9825320.1 hypothetical protein [Kineosporia succinea]